MGSKRMQRLLVSGLVIVSGSGLALAANAGAQSPTTLPEPGTTATTGGEGTTSTTGGEGTTSTTGGEGTTSTTGATGTTGGEGTTGTTGATGGEGTMGGMLEAGFVQKPLLGEEELAVGDLPATVLHAALAAMPDAEITAAVVDLDDVDAVYELTASSATYGDAVEIDVRADGTIEEIEIPIEGAEVSAAATELFDLVFGGFEVEAVEKSLRPTRSGLVEVYFEWSGTTPEGIGADVEIDAAGSQFLVELETTDDQ